MKKLIGALFCALLLSASLMGCSVIMPPEESSSQSEESIAPEKDSPAATAVRFLDAVSAFDKEELTATVADLDQEDWLDFPDNPDPAEAVIIALAEDYLSRLDYRLGRTTVIGDKGDMAEVSVEITVPDLTDTMNDLIGEVVKQAAMSALSGKELDAETLLSELVGKINIAALPKVTTEAVIPMIRQSDDTWLVDGDSEQMEALANAISGGVMEKVMAYADQMQELLA